MKKLEYIFFKPAAEKRLWHIYKNSLPLSIREKTYKLTDAPGNLNLRSVSLLSIEVINSHEEIRV